MADVHAQADAAGAAGEAIAAQIVQNPGGRSDEGVEEQPLTPAIAPAPGVGGPPGVGATGPGGGNGTGGAATRAMSPDFMPGEEDLAQLMGNKSIAAFLAYVGVKEETMLAVLSELELQLNDYYQVAAMIAPHELEDTLSNIMT